MTDHHLPEATTHVDLDADSTAVWEALTSDEGFESWMGEGAAIDARPGGQMSAPDPATGIERAGTVDSVEPERELRYRWWPVDDPEASSSVSIRLEPLDHGTRVLVIERPVIVGQISNAAMPTQPRLAAWSWRCAMLAIRSSLPVRV